VFTEVTGVLVATKTSASAAAVISLPTSKGVVNYRSETIRTLVVTPSKLKFDVVN
jgi:hypothetical protein